MNVIDLYQGSENVDFEGLAAGGIELAVLKLGQGGNIKDAKYPEHCNNAQRAGMLTAGYFWLDPTYSAIQNFDNLNEILDGLLPGQRPKVIWIDVEQYWANWQMYLAHRRNKSLPASPTIPANQIESVTLEFLELAKRIDAKIGIYTRAYFLKDFAPGLIPILADYPVWFAQWPTVENPGKPVSVAEVLTKYATKNVRPSFPPGWTGSTNYEMWQWTGDFFRLLELGGAGCDLSFFRGTRQEYIERFGLEEIPQIDILTLGAQSQTFELTKDGGLQPGSFVLPKGIQVVPADRVTIEFVVAGESGDNKLLVPISAFAK